MFISGCILWNEFDLIIKIQLLIVFFKISYKNSILVNIDSSNYIHSFSSLLHIRNRYRNRSQL